MYKMYKAGQEVSKVLSVGHVAYEKSHRVSLKIIL